MGTRSLPHSGSSGRAPGQGEEVAIERPSCSYFQFQGSDTPGNRVDNSRVSSSASGRCDPRKGSFGGTCLDDSAEDLRQIQAGGLACLDGDSGRRKTSSSRCSLQDGHLQPLWTHRLSPQNRPQAAGLRSQGCSCQCLSAPWNECHDGGEGQVRQLRGANAKTFVATSHQDRKTYHVPSFFPTTRPRRMRTLKKPSKSSTVKKHLAPREPNAILSLTKR